MTAHGNGVICKCWKVINSFFYDRLGIAKLQKKRKTKKLPHWSNHNNKYVT